MPQDAPYLLHSESIPTMNIAIEGDHHNLLIQRKSVQTKPQCGIISKVLHLSSVVVAEASDPVCLFAFLLLQRPAKHNLRVSNNEFPSRLT